MGGSAAAEALVELDDVGGLLKAEVEHQLPGGAAGERDRDLDMVGNPGADLVRAEADAHPEWLLVEDKEASLNPI